MANLKISELPAATTPLDAADTLVVVQGGATKKAPVSGLPSSGGGSTLTLNTQTASYTLVLADAGKYVRMNVGGANDLTVPPNSSVAFAVGVTIHVRQVGAGQTTVVAGSGVTITTPETLKLRKQHATASLVKVGTDTWELFGDLEAAP